MSIQDVTAVVDAMLRMERIHDAPQFDAYEFRVSRLIDLLEAYRAYKYHERVCEPSGLFVCTYRGVTYLIDEYATLWDLDEDGYLSPVSVGYYDGVDGVVTDLIKRGDLSDDFREHLKQYLLPEEDEA